MAQELIRHNVLSLDFWQDTVTYAGSVMPTGTIGCAAVSYTHLDVYKRQGCKRSAPPQTQNVWKASGRRLGSCAAASMSWSK